MKSIALSCKLYRRMFQLNLHLLFVSSELILHSDWFELILRSFNHRMFFPSTLMGSSSPEFSNIIIISAVIKD
jgi:hypothetical protein